MEIVEHQNEWLPGGEALDQVAHRPMGAEALRRRGRLVTPGIERAQRREHPAQLAQLLHGQGVELAWIERFEVFVQCVDDQPERKLALDLGGATAQSKAAAAPRPPSQLEQQTRLADAGLAGDEDEAWIART